MITNEIRKRFLVFFASKGHKIIASDSLVPKDDPTLLFTTAGMNQFKKQFLGNIADFRRAATCQKCLRTDDLDKVGKTPAHHTFFEMLGNFSFGDYFKNEAISWAWEFIIDVLKIPQEKLWVSVYHEDDESYEIWLNKIKVSKERIVKLGDKENFWPSEAKTKGPNGPCGPCSEIFYDFGSNVGCGKKECSPACECGRFVEIWNLVFTQFNRKAEGSLEPLPSKNIDTGMGLERLAAVMQGVYSNFEIDLFMPIISAIKRESAIVNPTDSQLLNIKIIADHIRAIIFAITDGINPSNEERGYVVRKLIRIGVNSCRGLGVKKPFLYKIIPAVIEVMKTPYPEIAQRRENIAEIVKREEESFLNIVEKQDVESRQKMKSLERAVPDRKILAVKMAELAFELYDTYGYPFDSTLTNANSLNLTIDHEKFLELMQEQKERSRSASSMGGDVFVDSSLKLNVKDTTFDGYKNLELNARILKILDKENNQINSSSPQKDIKIILDKTPFYGESGGQAGDAGFIEKDNAKLEVYDAIKADNVIVHLAKVINGEFKLNDVVKAAVDCNRRLSIARNHTATHLLQAALRKVLGAHVQQQGSLVAADRLRFDFTHFKALDKQELARVQQIVNQLIQANICLEVKEMTLDEAKKTGALAFFAEKYESNVRVVSIGNESRELCGGTHLNATGQIGLFKIISESSIAQGTRRIEAATGEEARRIIKEEENMINELTQILQVPQDKLVDAVKRLISNQKNLEKKISKLRMDNLKAQVDEIISKGHEASGAKIITQSFDDADMDFLRQAIDLLKRKISSGVVTLGSIKDDKVYIAMGITENLVKKGLNAVELIKDVAKIVDGSGGGRPDFAQAGGKQPVKLNEALVKASEAIKEKLEK